MALSGGTYRWGALEREAVVRLALRKSPRGTSGPPGGRVPEGASAVVYNAPPPPGCSIGCVKIPCIIYSGVLVVLHMLDFAGGSTLTVPARLRCTNDRTRRGAGAGTGRPGEEHHGGTWVEKEKWKSWGTRGAVEDFLRRTRVVHQERETQMSMEWPARTGMGRQQKRKLRMHASSTMK